MDHNTRRTPMTTTITGKHFTAKASRHDKRVWKVYNKKGRYIETFGGSEQAAKVRISVLDMVAKKLCTA